MPVHITAVLVTGLGTLITLIITGLGTLTGKYFQERTAKIKAQAEHRRAELAKANAIFDEIGMSMDVLAFFNLKAMYASIYDSEYNSEYNSEKAENNEDEDASDEDKVRYTRGEDEVRDTWNKYQNALVCWRQSKTRHLAQTTQYFGCDAREKLKEIQKDFRTLESRVDATYYNKKDSSHFLKDGADIRKKYFSIKPRLDKNIEALGKQMLECIQKLSLKGA